MPPPSFEQLLAEMPAKDRLAELVGVLIGDTLFDCDCTAYLSGLAVKYLSVSDRLRFASATARRSRASSF